ncbi:MAG: dienelactone hydrolase family protein, partial [bacterium]
MGIKKNHLLLILSFSFIAFGFSFSNAQGKSPDDTFRINPDDYSFWANVRSSEQFGEWREEVVKFYRKVIRVAPSYEPLPLDTTYTETIQISENLTRYRIEYGTTDGLRIPAYLFVPKTETPVPAVIVYHGHGEGKINAAEKEGTNENALARYLAENLGYVVLAPDSRSFGEFLIPNAKNHADYFYTLRFSNRLYMAKLMEDGYQDMALLGTIPQADMEHIGAAGISMGSWRTLNHAVLHEEIDAAVISGLYISWDYLFSPNHCMCQHIQKLAAKLKMEDFAATVFPRNLMIQWGLDDWFYRHDAEKLIANTEKIAQFLGWSEHFTVDLHKGMGHRFSNKEIADFSINISA